MVIINISGVNEIALTLKEKTTASAPVYLFEARAKDRNNVITIDPLTVIDTNDRWDQVQIDGTLFKAGQFSYKVTEKTTGDIVENGLLNAINEPRLGGWDSLSQYDNKDNEKRGRQI